MTQNIEVTVTFKKLGKELFFWKKDGEVQLKNGQKMIIQHTLGGNIVFKVGSERYILDAQHLILQFLKAKKLL